MNSGISFKKIWFDDDVIELSIETSDGKSSFSNKVYVDYQTIENLIVEFENFGRQVNDVYDFQFGTFELKSANGAFHAHLNFGKRGKIYITIRAQSEFKQFNDIEVAEEISLHLISEPNMLDNFITQIKSMRSGNRNDATLEALSME